MLNTILKKLNLCRAEELDAANKTIESQKQLLSECHKRNADLKSQADFSRTQCNSFSSRVQELESDLLARDEQIEKLNQELIDERHRYDRLQDFEVAESQEYASCKAELKEYKDAEVSGLLIKAPCLPGSTVYWVSRGFDSSVKPYAVEFNENLGYAVVELTVRAIIKNDKACMVLMDATSCIENMPSFHIEDFGKCVFTNLDDALSLMREIVENSTLKAGAEFVEPHQDENNAVSDENSIPAESDKSNEDICSSRVDASPDDTGSTAEEMSTILPEE